MYVNNYIVQANLTMDVRVVFEENSCLDKKLYHPSQSNIEVAAIFTGEDGKHPSTK